MRRAFVVGFCLAALCGCGQSVNYIKESRQATELKVGEVTTDSAIVWTRVTAAEQRSRTGLHIRGRPEKPGPGETIEQLDPNDLLGSAPGAPGRVRLRYDSSVNFFDPVATKWSWSMRRTISRTSSI